MIMPLIPCVSVFHSSGMSTDKNKELFLRQVEEILNGIKQDRERVSVVLPAPSPVVCDGVKMCSV